MREEDLELFRTKWEQEIEDKKLSEGLQKEEYEKLCEVEAIIKSGFSSPALTSNSAKIIVDEMLFPGKGEVVEVNVPPDGSCLFYSVALSVLLPLLAQEEAFKEAFVLMFGGKNVEGLEGIKGLLKNYDGSFALFENNPQLESLVDFDFRERLVGFMREHKDNFVEFCDDQETFERRMLAVGKPKVWGDQLEIEAISQFLNIKINLYYYTDTQELKAHPPHGEDFDREIFLVFTSVSPQVGAKKNHYHYLIESQYVPLFLKETYSQEQKKIQDNLPQISEITRGYIKEPLQEIKEILTLYYRPLIEYSETQSSDAPLWQLRIEALKKGGVYDALENLDETMEDEPALLLIYQLTARCQKELMTFSQLSIHEQQALVKAASNKKLIDDTLLPLIPYATSLLITFFLRDKSKDYRKMALILLKEGALAVPNFRVGSQEIDLDLKLLAKEFSTTTDLLRSFYMDLSYSDFTGLGPIKLDLSGQYLKGMNGYLTTFSGSKGSHFRYACLENANLNNATLKQCDFTKANLWKTQLKGAKIKRCVFNQVNGYHIQLSEVEVTKTDWKQSNLFNAILDEGTFTQTSFQGSDLSGISLRKTKLLRCNFTQSIGLTLTHLQAVETMEGCQLSTPYFSHKEQEIIRAWSQEKGQVEFVISQTPLLQAKQQLNTLISNLLRSEAIAYQEDSPLWRPFVDRWQHEPNWHGENQELMLCDLKPEDPLYTVLERFVHATSDTMSYESKRFEFSRLKKAMEKKELLDFIQQELKSPPGHQGRAGSIKIESIQLNYHPACWTQYQKRKQKLLKELEGLPHPPLSHVDWHREHHIAGLPVLNPKVGECWLFHGTHPSIAPLIIQHGFTTKYITYKPFVGYGALGKGLYFTDAFPKAATYVICPTCEQNQCQCPIEERLEKQDKEGIKTLIIARVLLGKPYINKDKSRRGEEVIPEGYHSCFGPSQVNEEESQFVCNEFMIENEAQIYPEFCIFYRDYVPSPSLKKTQVKLPDLKMALEDYQRLISFQAPKWQCEEAYTRLLNQLEGLLNQSMDRQQYAELEELLENVFKKEHTANPHAFYWAIDYFQHEQWEQAIYALEGILDGLSPIQKTFALILQGMAYYQLEQSYNMLKAFNSAWLLDEKQLIEHLLQSSLLDHYYLTSLEALKSGYSEEDHFELFIIRIATWTVEQLFQKRWDFNTWEKHYWELPDTFQRKHFRQALYELKNKSLPQDLIHFIDHLPDETGYRLSTKQNKTQFHETLFHLTQEDETQVQIRWLSREETNYVIETGYLKSEFIQLLFQEEGSLIPDERQPEGRSLVKCLRDSQGNAITYIKFYPHYPLRQFAIDSLCERLSGYSTHTTLAWVKHKNKDIAYPVLLSQPLGPSLSKEPVTLLHYQQRGKDQKLEQHSDVKSFTWKMLESLLTQPKDNKNDNVVPIQLHEQSPTYAWVSVDNDESFIHKTCDKEQVYCYDVTLLMEAMDLSPHPNVLSSFLKYDWKALLNNWLDEIDQYTRQLTKVNENTDFLFRPEELTAYKDLTQKVVTFKEQSFGKRGYNVTCHVEDLFRDNDLTLLYETIQRLQVAIKTLKDEEEVTHWSLLEKIDPHLTEHYQGAYQKEQTSSKRFQELPGVKDQFSCQVISVDKLDEFSLETKILVSQSTQPEKKVFHFLTRFQKPEAYPIQPYHMLLTQRKKLNEIDHYFYHILKLYNALQKEQQLETLQNTELNDLIRAKVINQVHWKHLKPEFAQQLLASCQSIAFRSLRLRECSEITDDIFKKILAKSPELEILHLSTCPLLTKRSLRSIERQNQLHTLYIHDMPWKHTMVSTQNGFTQLRGLSITDCEALESCDLYLPECRQLTIKGCGRLKTINLYAPYLRHCVVEWDFEREDVPPPQFLLNGQEIDLNLLAKINQEKMKGNEQAIIEMVLEALKTGDITYFVTLIDVKLKEKVLEKFSFYNLEEKETQNILNALLPFQGLKKLILKDCKLDVDELENLLRTHEDIKKLELIDCKVYNAFRSSNISLSIKNKLLEQLTIYDPFWFGYAKKVSCYSSKLQILKLKNCRDLQQLKLITSLLKEIHLNGDSVLSGDAQPALIAAPHLFENEREMRLSIAREHSLSFSHPFITLLLKQVALEKITITCNPIGFDKTKYVYEKYSLNEYKNRKIHHVFEFIFIVQQAFLFQELDFSNCLHLTDEWLEHILQRCSSQLKVIRIDHCPNTTLRSWEIITQYTPWVKAVYAAGNAQWNSTSTGNFKKYLTQVEVLDFEGVKVRNRFLPTIKENLKTLKIFQFLDIPKNIFTYKLFKDFFDTEDVTLENFQSFIHNCKQGLILKIISVGTVASGKTSNIKRYINNNYSENYKPTVGVDFGLKTLEIEGKKIVTQFWDVAFQEIFGSMTRVYYKDMCAAILCIPVNEIFTQAESIIKWARDIEVKVYTDFPVSKLLVISKMDLFHELGYGYEEYLRQVYFLVKETRSIGYQECSAKKRYGVNEAFDRAIHLGLSYYGREESVSLKEDIGQAFQVQYNQSLELLNTTLNAPLVLPIAEFKLNSYDLDQHLNLLQLETCYQRIEIVLELMERLTEEQILDLAFQSFPSEALFIQCTYSSTVQDETYKVLSNYYFYKLNNLAFHYEIDENTLRSIPCLMRSSQKEGLMDKLQTLVISTLFYPGQEITLLHLIIWQYPAETVQLLFEKLGGGVKELITESLKESLEALAKLNPDPKVEECLTDYLDLIFESNKRMSFS